MRNAGGEQRITLSANPLHIAASEKGQGQIGLVEAGPPRDYVHHPRTVIIGFWQRSDHRFGGLLSNFSCI